MSYASIFIEKVLGMKESSGTYKFGVSGVEQLFPICESLTVKILSILKPENTLSICVVNENEFLMKLLLRIIFCLRENIIPLANLFFQDLFIILQEIAKNPKTPKFNHFLFESLGALISFAYSSRSLQDQAAIELMALPIYQYILQSDVVEFIPYVFILVASMMENSKQSGDISPNFLFLFEPLLTPALWTNLANIPSLSRLLESFIFKAPQLILTRKNYLESILGIFQTLLLSKSYDQFGFEILRVAMQKLPAASFEPYLQQIFLKILQRAQNNKSMKFTKCFAVFLANFLCSFQTDRPENTLFALLESIQPK